MPTTDGAPAPDPLAEYQAVVTKVQAFADHAEATQRPFLACAAGCDGCCRTRRTAWGVELVAIATWLAAHPAVHQQITQRRTAPDIVDGTRCVFLDASGRCDIYPARPILCRTHGPAVRTPEGLAWCGLNFSGLDATEVAEAVPAAQILDLAQVDPLLAIVNQRFQATMGGPLRGPLDAALDFEWEDA